MSTGTPVAISRIQNRRGTQAEFDALYPPGYTGVGGATGPNILQPGEFAFCMDTRKVFIGNENGEYVELATNIITPTDISLLPNVTLLPPQSTFTIISDGLEWLPTPFVSIIYDVTDATEPGPIPTPANTVGVNFAKNGELKITSVQTTCSLTDTGSEINNYPTYVDPLLGVVQPDISFDVIYDGGIMKLRYKHNFPVPLTFSTSSIIWAPILV